MRIAYVTGASFNSPNAAALRNVGVATALAIAGHDVAILTPDAGSEQFASWLPEIPSGVKVIPLGDDGDPRSTRARMGSLVGRSHPGLELLVANWKPELFLVYQSFLPLLMSVNRRARRLHIPVVVDVTEWYDGASLPYGSLGPHNILNELSMRAVIPRFRAVIAVSTGLADHVSRRGARTLVVPPLFQPSVLGAAGSGAPRDFRKLRIAVIGSGITPGQKDRVGLLAIAAAARAMDPAGDMLDVQVAGPTLAAVEAALGEPIPKSFTVHGPVPWVESLELVAGADFSLVVRVSGVKRNRLGFPSKVPESLLLGTPILGNAVGDLHTYLVDGKNAAIMADATAPALRSAIERIMNGTDAWNRDQIRRDAEEWFAPQAYAEPLSAFLSDARELR